MIHCISGQPDVIGRHLPGDDVIFHSYDQPLPSFPVGAILILHEPPLAWLKNPAQIQNSTHRILLAENPSAGAIKFAVNQIGVVRISDLASLSKAIKELFRDSALIAAQRMVEGLPYEHPSD